MLLYLVIILLFAIICIGFPTTLNIITAIIAGSLILLGIKCLRATKGTDDSLAKAGSWMFMLFGIFVIIIRFSLF